MFFVTFSGVDIRKSNETICLRLDPDVNIDKVMIYKRQILSYAASPPQSTSLEIYYYNPTTMIKIWQKVIFFSVSIQGFLSPRLVALHWLKNPVCLTLYPSVFMESRYSWLSQGHLLKSLKFRISPHVQ